MESKITNEQPVKPTKEQEREALLDHVTTLGAANSAMAYEMKIPEGDRCAFLVGWMACADAVNRARR